MKIARIVTIPYAFVHIKPLLLFLKTKKNISVTLISSAGDYERTLQSEIGMGVNEIEIPREISPAKDIQALFKLYRFFRKNKFDILHSSTPKAGLLTALAGAACTSAIRLHTFTGQRWAGMRGFKRRLLKGLDRIIILLNTQCYADSHSQINFLISEGVAKAGELRCLHKGSYGGIDCEKFDNNKYPQARALLQAEASIDTDDVVLLFAGRLTRDKGIEELVEAFTDANSKNKRLKLVLIGSYEPKLDPLKAPVLEQIAENPSIIMLGFKTNPEMYYSAADIFCLPSYREGFGTVVLEAAACGLPCIGSKIPGLVDAVVDGETGLLVPLRNHGALVEAISTLADDVHLRKTLGQCAKKRAHTDFSSKILAEAQLQEYERLLRLRKH